MLLWRLQSILIASMISAKLPRCDFPTSFFDPPRGTFRLRQGHSLRRAVRRQIKNSGQRVGNHPPESIPAGPRNIAMRGTRNSDRVVYGLLALSMVGAGGIFAP